MKAPKSFLCGIIHDKNRLKNLVRPRCVKATAAGSNANVKAVRTLEEDIERRQKNPSLRGPILHWHRVLGGGGGSVNNKHNGRLFAPHQSVTLQEMKRVKASDC